MKTSPVAVIGDACVDMVIRLPDRSTGAPPPTHFTPQLYGGGSAANTAVALSRLGVASAMTGTVGDDSYGRWVRDDLYREGVDVCGVGSIRDAFTPMVIALIEPDGERRIVVWPPEGGAHLQLQRDAIDPAAITSASWIHTTGMCLRASPSRETVLYVMELAKESGTTVSLDLNLRLESWGLDDKTRTAFERAIELSDVVFGNAEEEIVPIAGADSTETAAQQLSDGRRVVVARQGSKGALTATPEKTFHVSAFQTEVVDTLGAGDAFNGGFIAARLAGTDTKEAVRRGHATAALKIGRAGARGLPSLDELKQMLGPTTPGP